MNILSYKVSTIRGQSQTDSGDRKANFLKPFFDAYHAKHDNVSVIYSGPNWTAIQQEITLGVRNGTAPDVFQLPSTITLAQAFVNKWVGAYDDIVQDTLKSRVAQMSLFSGSPDRLAALGYQGSRQLSAGDYRRQ